MTKKKMKKYMINMTKNSKKTRHDLVASNEEVFRPIGLLKSQIT